MSQYQYECECGYNCVEQHGMNDNPLIRCPKCGEELYRVITGGTGFIFAEGNGDISDKPDSYWANAEQNRIKGMKKRHKEQDEKVRFKDKGMVTMLENKERNFKEQGSVVDQDAVNRILDAGQS